MSIFGGHQVAAPSQPAAAVVAVVSNETPSASTTGTVGSQSSPAIATTTIINQYITQPVIEHTIQTKTSQSLSQLQADIAGFQVQIDQILSAQHPSYLSGAPAVITFPGNTIPPADALPSTATVGGLPIATTHDVSSTLTNYLPLAGGELTGALGIGTASPFATLTINGVSGDAAANLAINAHQIWVGPTGFNDLSDYAGSANRNSLNVFTADAASTTQVTNSLLGWTRVSTTTPSAQGVTGLVTDEHPSGDVSWLYGVEGDIYVNSSGNTSAAFAHGTNINKQGSGTLTDAINYYSEVINYGGGNITNAYGFYAEDYNGVASSTYGIYLNQTAGTNSFAYYGTGDAPSYFGGNVGIGTTTPVEPLTIQGLVPSRSWLEMRVA